MKPRIDHAYAIKQFQFIWSAGPTQIYYTAPENLSAENYLKDSLTSKALFLPVAQMCLEKTANAECVKVPGASTGGLINYKTPSMEIVVTD